MEPLDYLKALRTRWRVVAACFVLLLVVAWVTTPAKPKGSSAPSITTYQATATLLQPPGTQRSLAYTALFVTKGDVPGRVAARLHYTGDPAVLAARVSVTSNDAIGSLTIMVSDNQGAEAARIANTFGEEIIAYLRKQAQDETSAQVALLSQQLKDVNDQIATAQARLNRSPNDVVLKAQRDGLANRYSALYTQLQQVTADGAKGPQLDFLQRATPIPLESGGFTAPTSRRGRLVLGALIGLMLGAAAALVLERFDVRLRRRADIGAAYRMPVLTEVPALPRRVRRSAPIVVRTMPVSAPAEAYRSLRSAVQLLNSRSLPSASGGQLVAPPPPEVLLVTSARSGEGKTSTVVNLAASMAESGKQVLVLDCDFRGPAAHRYLDIAQGPGLAELLGSDGEDDLVQLARPTAVPGVKLVPAGLRIGQPAVLPARMAAVLRSARDLADIVIVDSAPMLVANDALDLMPNVDSVAVVCRSGRTTREQAQRCSDLLERLHVPVLGVVCIGMGGDSGGRSWFSRPYSSASRLRHVLQHQSSQESS